MDIKLTFSKSTKNTHVYVDDAEGAPVPTLYIKKDALPSPAPTTITVVIKPE